MRPPNLAHIVNPVVVPETSDLHIAQPITFETMRRAQAAAAGTVDVELFSAQYPEDRAAVPAFLTPTEDLTRSSRDVHGDQRARRLPLIADVLDRLYRASEADHLIYTNVDIAVAANFYTAIAAFVEGGYDALTITRRTVSKRFRSVDDIPAMLHRRGRSHPGWDCFVFPRRLVPRMELGSVCIGAPGVGLVLLANGIRHAERFGVFRDERLTFHRGNDRRWLLAGERAASVVNHREAMEIVRRLHAGAPDGERKDLLRRYAELPDELAVRWPRRLLRRLGVSGGRT